MKLKFVRTTTRRELRFGKYVTAEKKFTSEGEQFWQGPGGLIGERLSGVKALTLEQVNAEVQKFCKQNPNMNLKVSEAQVAFALIKLVEYGMARIVRG